MLTHRPRLLAAAALGVVVAGGGQVAGMELPLALLAGWWALALSWMVLVLPMMLRARDGALRERTAAMDDGRWAILLVTVAAVLASLGAVAWALVAAPSPAPRVTLVLGLGTVPISWVFVHVLFAVHYAHEHVRAGAGITFPGDDSPDFEEFLYFSFTIGMTFQVSDATTATRAVRRLVLVHGLVSFVFNVVILGIAVNLAAALAQ